MAKSGGISSGLCYLCADNFQFYKTDELRNKRQTDFQRRNTTYQRQISKKGICHRSRKRKNPQWNDFVKVQLIQDRCDLLENISLQENIKVYFNIRGRKWENKGQTSYFTNLEGWRIEKLESRNPADIPVPEYRVEDIPPMPEADDLPF